MTYTAFLEDDFTVKHTSNKGIGVPLDQVLQKKYKKSAKGPSRIIWYTRRKESVLKWNIIHHEKRQFTDFLYYICCIDDESEYSLHHEISDAKTEADVICVSQLENYISHWGNPFNTENQGIKNLDTNGLRVHMLSFEKVDLLKHEITRTSFYLTEEDFLRKRKKSEFTTVIKELLTNKCLSEVPMCNKKAMVVLDFMAYVRKVPVKKAKLKTYGDMTKHLWNTFTKLASDYAKIDIVFDLYTTFSIKETEQNRKNAVEAISTDKFESEHNFFRTQKEFG